MCAVQMDSFLQKVWGEPMANWSDGELRKLLKLERRSPPPRLPGLRPMVILAI